MAESELTITTGGLGPTRDDITKPLLADIFGGEMAEDVATSRNIEEIFAGRGLALNELTRRQAWVPSSCRVIINRCGTAPIMWFERGGRVLVAMPGVPYETRGMLPEVARQVGEYFGTADRIMHREFTVTGITESGLAERLASFEDSLPDGFKLAYLPSPGEIVLRLDGRPGADADEFESIAERLCNSVGTLLAGVGKLTPAEMLLHRLRAAGLTLATAESCTGGNIAHSITEVAGCSDVFKGGVVSYANEVKTNVLGVDAEVIASQGAVSEEVVRQMCQGAARLCGADCAVATSGIAGPGGGSPEKPVGTVWIAARTPRTIRAELFHFRGDRQAVIERATAQAMTMLSELLNGF